MIQKEEKPEFLKGQEYFYGYGQLQNYHKALQHFQLAEQQGSIEASVSIGKMYLKGRGVDRNYRKAFEHFKRAADQKHPDGYYYLGNLIENDLVSGSGVSK